VRDGRDHRDLQAGGGPDAAPENWKLTPEERVRELMALLEAAEEFARAGRTLRGER
jgi:hypothetical protein